jgi:elongation factor Ts
MQTTYKPTADEVKRLREDSGAGMIDCRNALVKSEGDLAKAKVLLQEQGQAKADKKAERKVGVLVEINCETDFVARNDKFKDLVRDVAMHIAAMPAAYLTREEVPADKVAELRAEFVTQIPPGKPPAVGEKIVEGKLNKWFEDHVVLEQSFVKDDSVTVGELVNGVSSVLGEKMSVRRFAKFALGE